MQRELVVPTLVPKPRSPTVTQENLPGRKSEALRSLRLSQITLDPEIRSQKIRRGGSTEARSADRRTQCALAQPAIHSAPGHHLTYCGFLRCQLPYEVAVRHPYESNYTAAFLAWIWQSILQSAHLVPI